MISTTGPLSWKGQELTVYPPRWPLRAVWGTGDQLTLRSVEFNTSTDTSSGGAKGTRIGNRTHICLRLNKRVTSHKFTHTQQFPEATKATEGKTIDCNWMTQTHFFRKSAHANTKLSEDKWGVHGKGSFRDANSYGAIKGHNLVTLRPDALIYYTVTHTFSFST